MQPFVQPLANALGRLQEATLWLAQKSLTDRDEIGAAATDYLRLFGLVALAYMCGRSAKLAHGKIARDKDGFYSAKLTTARFFMSRLLPQTQGILAALKSGAGPVMDFRDEWF
jgi:hypothetical protein